MSSERVRFLLGALLLLLLPPRLNRPPPPDEEPEEMRIICREKAAWPAQALY
jgi:hypothetical protein